MSKTILITGASTGIGKATALHFAKNNWNVVATMRSPEKETDLLQFSNVLLLKLDVTDISSIQSAIETSIQKYTKIDVVLNNAGFGLVGVFEAITPEQIHKQFDTNVFGVMNVIRAILPHFRANKAGLILNTTSMGGLIAFPLYSVYHATKWALEGFSESLHYELRQHNIQIKNIEPGAIKTDFYSRSMDYVSHSSYEPYASICQDNMQNEGANAVGPEVVVATIYKAATDHSSKLRYPAGGNSSAILFARWLLPISVFIKIVRAVVEKGFRNK